MPFEVRAVEGMPVLKESPEAPTASFTLRVDDDSARAASVFASMGLTTTAASFRRCCPNEAV